MFNIGHLTTWNIQEASYMLGYNMREVDLEKLRYQYTLRYGAKLFEVGDKEMVDTNEVLREVLDDMGVEKLDENRAEVKKALVMFGAMLRQHILDLADDSEIMPEAAAFVAALDRVHPQDMGAIIVAGCKYIAKKENLE